MTTPSYKVYADWDGDGGLDIGDFEFGLDGWDPSASGALPTVAQSTTRSYHGTTSMLVTWSSGTSQLVQADPRTFTIGRSYTYSAWVYVPSSGGMAVKCTLPGGSSGSASAVTNTWTPITLTFTATATSHTLQITPNSSPSGGEQTWVDRARVIGPGEDLTATPPGVISDVTIQYGRDQARSLQPVSPGEASCDVDNVSRDYSPENSSSPLAGLLGPGREVLIEATLAGQAYTLFAGNIDDFTIDSSPGTWLAQFSAVDALARIKDRPVSTAVYPAVRTGQAIGYILDAIGWTGKRDLDPGGSTIRWWHAESDDAYQEMLDVLSAEGPDSFVSVGSSGEFVFRDRHHRLNRAESLTSQVTFTNGIATGGQVEHDAPFKLDFGWRDIINVIHFDVTDRDPVAVAEQIWVDENIYLLAGGEHRQFKVVADDPFWDVVDPTQGLPADLPTEGVQAPDFVADGTLTVTFSRRSGKSTVMDVTCSSATIIFKMSLRAYPVKRTDNVQKVIRSDAASIASVGLRSRKEPSPWINAEDAGAVADLIIGKRAQRLPVVTFTVINGTSTAITHQLARDLSDRVTVVDSESGFNADCFIERISHEITDDGNTHRTTFACEKIPTLPGNVLRFDTTGAGFNDGVFAPNGLIDPSDVFRFDTAGQGFNDGLLAF